MHKHPFWFWATWITVAVVWFMFFLLQGWRHRLDDQQQVNQEQAATITGLQEENGSLNNQVAELTAMAGRVNDLEMSLQVSNKLLEWRALHPSGPDQQAKVEIHESPQILVGDTPQSSDPADRNLMVLIYGRAGDELVIQQDDKGFELWIHRGGLAFQNIPGAYSDPVTKESIPADVFVLFDEYGKVISWTPTTMMLEIPEPPVPSSQS